MATNGSAEDVSALFHDIGDLEKSFADVELNALRRKEFDLKDLYSKREQLLKRVPEFWPTVFLNAPEEVQQLYSPADMPVLAAIKSFTVERYQIKSETEGEPRSLRFTFEIGDNECCEETDLVKEFEYKPSESGPGGFVSKPVPIQWKSKKKDPTNGLLDAGVELQAAEDAMMVKQSCVQVAMVEREGLWQYEKLREKLEMAEEASDEEPSFLNWFGFRGAVAEKPAQDGASGNAAEDDDDDDDDDEDDGMLDVEIFPAGEEVAITLAEDLWPNVMDYFMQAQEDPVDFEGFEEESDEVVEDVEDEDAPELVDQELVEEVKDDRPRKKQRTG